MKRFLFFTGILAIFSFTLLAQETLTITTYYPAPFGVYQEIRSRRLAVGPNYFNSATHPWDDDNNIIGTEISQEADLVVENRIGVNTINPQAPLHVQGGVFIRGGNGDVNGDGVVDISDALLAVNYVNGIGQLTPAQYARADIDGDGRVTATDASLLVEHVSSGSTLRHDKRIADRAFMVSRSGWVNVNSPRVGVGMESFPFADPNVDYMRAALTVNGAVQIGTTNILCDPGLTGTLRVHHPSGGSPQLQMCDGANWSNVGGGGQPAAPVHGTYRGKNQYRNYQTITLGFRPKVVVIFGIFSGFHMDKPGFQTIVLGIEGNDIIGAIDIIDTGFRVKGVYLNYPASRTYSYLVW